MGLVAVTGASGFIGRDVCRFFRANGDDVVALGRSGSEQGLQRWSLGDRLPDACRSARTIVHLACATLGAARSDRARAMEIDIAGTRRLVEQLREWRRAGGRHRFIFVSSQSAGPRAANDYGRSKWEIEQILTESDEVIVRPGLVYSDPPVGVFAMFERLSRLPAVPAFKAPASIQPVLVGEVADAIFRVSALPRPPRLLMVGAVRPLTFAEAVAAAAKRGRRRPPVMVPMPTGAVRFAAVVVDRLWSSTLTERLDGLLTLQPIDTEPSLATLGMNLAPF